jgi:hypothetical protein
VLSLARSPSFEHGECIAQANGNGGDRAGCPHSIHCLALCPGDPAARGLDLEPVDLPGLEREHIGNAGDNTHVTAFARL